MKHLFLKVYFGLVFLFLAVFFLPSFAKDSVIEKGPGGEVNWQAGELILHGMGSVPTGKYSASQLQIQSRAAVFENLKETFIHLIGSFRINSETTVQDMLNQDPNFKDELFKVFYAGQINEYHFYPNGDTTVTLCIPFYGEVGLSKILFYSLYPPREANLGNSIRDYLIPTRNAAMQFNNAAPYTGLIINADGMAVLPSFGPSVLSWKKELIYGFELVDFQFALQYGLVQFETSLKNARMNSKRVGKNPLVINAIKALGPFKSDIQILSKDAARIKAANQITNFLEKCRVIVVVSDIKSE